jgi:hypothetical protein
MQESPVAILGVGRIKNQRWTVDLSAVGMQAFVY